MKGHMESDGFHPHKNNSKKISSDKVAVGKSVHGKSESKSRMLIESNDNTLTHGQLQEFFKLRKEEIKSQYPDALTESIMTTSDGPEWLVTTYENSKFKNGDYEGKIVDQYGIRQLREDQYEIINDKKNETLPKK